MSTMLYPFSKGGYFSQGAYYSRSTTDWRIPVTDIDNMTLRDYIYDERNTEALLDMHIGYKGILRQVYVYIFDLNVLTFDVIVRCYNILEGEDKMYLSNNIGFSYVGVTNRYSNLLPSVKIEKNDVKFFAALSVEVSRYYYFNSIKGIYLHLRDLYSDIGENIYDDYLSYVEDYLGWVYRDRDDKDFKVQQRKDFIIEDISKF